MAAARKKPVRLCSVCGNPQRSTPSGLVCSEGHGGAETVDAKPVTKSVTQRARRVAFNAINAAREKQADVMVRASLSSIARKVLHGMPKDGQCCQWEDRDMSGGCRNCGDPCL